MDIEITVDSDVLDKPPEDRLETEEGGSITWNLLCHSGGVIPVRETTNGVTTIIEGNYSLKDLTNIRDRFLAGELGVKPSGYIGHENRTSATPSVGTVEDLVIVAPTELVPFYSLYFKCLWTPEGRRDINTGRYKYVSIEAREDDRGWLMTGFALTNEPACRPMREIQASSIQEEINTNTETKTVNENNNGGYTMDQKELDILIKVLDPKLVMQALLQTKEGKEAIAEVIKENMELLGGESEETQTEETTTTEDTPEGKTTEETQTEETTTTESSSQEESDKEANASSEEGDKTAQASSIVSQVGKMFDSTIKDLKGSIKATSSQIAEARKTALASSLTIGGEQAVRQVVGGLVGNAKVSPTTSTRKVEAMASSINNSSTSPVAGALSNLGRTN